MTRKRAWELVALLLSILVLGCLGVGGSMFYPRFASTAELRKQLEEDPWFPSEQWYLERLDQGADPNVRTGSGRTLLLVGAQKRSTALVERALAAGQDPNATARDGTSPLVAAICGSRDPDYLSDEPPALHAVIRLLIAAGAAVDAVPRQPGDNPLIHAAGCDQPGVIRILHEAGAQLNEQSASGTPLMTAAAWGNVRAATTLLQLGADPQVRDGLGSTALNHAIDGHKRWMAALHADGVPSADEESNRRYETVKRLLTDAGCRPGSQASSD
jgi:ankyrin repeat protein